MSKATLKQLQCVLGGTPSVDEFVSVLKAVTDADLKEADSKESDLEADLNTEGERPPQLFGDLFCPADVELDVKSQSAFTCVLAFGFVAVSFFPSRVACFPSSRNERMGNWIFVRMH